jgi:hypothetical protein
MATSGTVAQTALDTAVILEHACRRCGVPAAAQTPEIVEIGKQNLYLLLLNLANRGLNLWCVERNFVPLTANQATYSLDSGTIRPLNVLYSQPTRASGTNTTTATSVSTALTAATGIVRWGFKLATGVTGTMLLESSTNGITYTTAQSLASTAWGTTWHWYEVDPKVTAQYWRVTSSVAATFSEFYLASAVKDLPMTPFNRDEYTQQPNKHQSGAVSTNYYYSRTVSPSLSVWPVPDNSYDHLSVWRHRFVQDVGSLTQQIEVPQYWVEAVIWMLAARLTYELPNIDANRQNAVIQASQQFLLDAETAETDNAPVYIIPGIGVYTR